MDCTHNIIILFYLVLWDDAVSSRGATWRDEFRQGSATSVSEGRRGPSGRVRIDSCMLLPILVACAATAKPRDEMLLPQDAAVQPQNIMPEFSFPVNIERVDQSCQYWNEVGSEALQDGRIHDAVEAFTLASHQHSSDGALWTNLAVSLATLASMQREDAQAALVTLCEAKAAAHLAINLGHADLGGLLEALSAEEEDASQAAGMGCEATVGGVEQVLLDEALDGLALAVGAESVQARNITEHAVRQLCTPAIMTRQLGSTAERARGIFTAKTLRLAWGLMRVCGVFAVEDVLAPEIVTTVAKAQTEHFANISARAARHLDGSQRWRYAANGIQLAMRGSAHRAEVQLPMGAPFDDERLVANPLGLSLLRMLLGGDDVEIDTFSYIRAAPGSPAQKWHADVDPLFSKQARQRGFSSPLPPHAIVQIAPLTNMNHDNGATEFVCASHILEEHLEETDPSAQRPSEERIVQLSASPGSLLLFDVRLRHRGGANNEASSRTVLYSSYVRSWFRDSVNFKESRSREWDRLPSHRLRKLFSRVDARRYVRLLEDRLRAEGVDPVEIASAIEYREQDLRM